MRFFAILIFIIVALNSNIDAKELLKNKQKSIKPNKILIFKGNKALSDSFLYENLNLVAQKNWYEFYKDKKPKINQIIVKPLVESLYKLYKSQGFFKVKITDKIQKDKIIFYITENKPIKISNIKIISNIDIKKFITFKKGDRFIINKFITIRSNLKKYLKSIGYCNYDLSTKAYVDLKKYEVKLVYKLNTNKKCKFGKIIVKTPKSIDEDVILSRLFYKSGDTYSSKKILKSYEKLMGLDTFDSINIKEENSFGNTIETFIDTTLKKARIKKEIGLGYETKYGPKIFFRWEQRNFKGNARKLGFDIKYSKNERYIKNLFYNPAFIKIKKYDIFFDLKNEFGFSKTFFDKFYERKYSNILHFFRDFDTYSLDLGIDFEKIYIKRTNDPCYIDEGNFILLSPFVKFILDLRDSKIDPKNGVYFSSYFESGLTYLASSTSYSKLLIEGRIIKTALDFTLAIKGKVGLIKEFQKSLPESKLFFAGGAFSNRAYGYNKLGAFDGRCTNMGGKTLLDNSIEISHPIYKNLSFAIFLDSTMISVQEEFFDLDFIHSYGFGFRYKTLIGPLKIDYGVNSKDSSIYAIHFQIGQSF